MRITIGDLSCAPSARAAAPGGPRTITSAARDCLYGAKDNPFPTVLLSISDGRVAS